MQVFLESPNTHRIATVLEEEKNLWGIYMALFTLMHFRKEKNKDSIHEVEEAVDAKYSFSFVENADHRMLLESAMEILEEEERQILFLHAVAGWKNREIAEYLGKNLNTVLSKYQRSIKKLQEHLGKDE